MKHQLPPDDGSFAAEVAQFDAKLEGNTAEPTFEERWEALELHAGALACQNWSVMKSIASLAGKASELEITRLTQRQLEQLLEAAQRKVRAKSAPINAGGTFTIRSTPWAVDGIFRHGLNLLVGQSGAGKSRLAAACMAAWLRGDETWISRPLQGCNQHHRHALIIGSDQPLEDWHLTLAPVGLSWKEEGTDDLVRIHDCLTLYGLESGLQLDSDGLATIRRWVDHHPGGMVLIDSLAACLPAGVDEDKASAARPIHALQEAIGDAWAILTHHTRKGAGKEGNLGVGAGRGSGAIDAAVSRVIGLGLIHKMENGVWVAQESDPRRELLSTKRGGKTEHLIISSDETGFWSVHGTADELKWQERQERALANLTDAQSDALASLEAKDGWLTVRDVVEATSEDGEDYNAHSSKAATARKILKRLEVLGLAESQRVGAERVYRAKQNHSHKNEIELTGSPGSPTAGQGISLAHPLAHAGSLGQGEPVAAINSGNFKGEPGEPINSEGEPAGEPPKPVALQGVSQVSLLNFPGCSPTGSPGPINSEFPVGALVEINGPLGWRGGYQVIAGPDADGFLKVRSLHNQRGRPPQPHRRNVRLAQQEVA